MQPSACMGVFKNIVFFRKNCQMKNIQNLISYEEGYIDFCLQTSPSLQNGRVLPQMVFHRFFNKNTVFFLKLV